MLLGSWAADQGAYPPRAQLWAPRTLIRVPTYQGVLGLCVQEAWPLIWVHTDLGVRCVLGLREWGHKGPQLLQRIL